MERPILPSAALALAALLTALPAPGAGLAAQAAVDSAAAEDPAGPEARMRVEEAAGGETSAVRLRLTLAPPDSGPSPATYVVEVRWNPARLELAGAEAGTAAGRLASGAETTDGAGGRLLLRDDRPDAVLDSAATLVTATLRAGPGLAEGDTARVEATFRALAGPGGQEVTSRLRGHPASACVMADPRGDVDGDGRVTSHDAALVLREAIGMAPGEGHEPARGDLDGDGRADSADARRLLERVLGGEEAGPPGGAGAVADSAGTDAGGAARPPAGRAVGAESAGARPDSTGAAADSTAGRTRGGVATAAAGRPLRLGACP